MKKKLLFTFLGTILIGSIALPITLTNMNAPSEGDIDFEDESIISADLPSRVKSNDEESIPTPDKVIIHYHNDDMNCLNRRFYTWVTGVDGIERKPDASNWTASDMMITLDFTLPELAEYKVDMPSMFFIIKIAGTWAGQSEDIELKYEVFPPDETGTSEVWCIPGEGSSVEMYHTQAETNFPKVKTAKFTDFKTIHCEATEVPMYYNLYAFDKNYLNGTPATQVADKQYHLFKSGKPTSKDFDISFNYTAKINVQYRIETEYASNPGRIQTIIVSYENLYKTERFEKYYTYQGNDLGMTYKDNGVTFKVWAPTAASAYVNIYNIGIPKSLGGNDAGRVYEMSYVKGGVWQVTIVPTATMPLKDKFYTYSLINSSGSVEAMDPYAKACGLNGLRGFIYDKDDPRCNPEGWSDVPAVWDKKEGYDINNTQDLSIYEAHIRDLTMDETWISNKGNARGTYNAFCESGTTLTKYNKTVSTGFDHIKDLGVKAVQLIPVFDNDNDERSEKIKFNWGYNPLNYNCVEGGYSSDPSDPYARIYEYKNLIKTFSEKRKDSSGNEISSDVHTRIIMDVVYNHVAGASSSCFTKIMPKYYFRYTPNWEYYDGSGCSNEVQSDATMMRKFIVDSLCWWASEYKIKGFRFDLMGLIDTWTLRQAKEALYQIDPDICLYGEGWTAAWDPDTRGYHGKVEVNSEGKQINGGAFTDNCYSILYESSSSKGKVGAFNDNGRDRMRGGNDDGYNNNPYPTWGFLSQGSGDIGDKSNVVANMLRGVYDDSIGANPNQTINYLSCHDNYTLFDQLSYTLAPGYDANHCPTGNLPVENVINASLTGHAAIMMSNGVAFIQGGEEIYRSKTYIDEDLTKLMEEEIVRPYPDYPHYTPDPDVLDATADVRWFNNKVVSHNSYKAPDGTNAFKWDRKIQIDSVDTYKYIEKWNEIIRLHDETPKVEYGDVDASSKLNTWNNGNGSTSLALWNGNKEGTSGYYLVISGRDTSYLPIDLTNATLIASNKNYESYTDSWMTLSPWTYLIYKKGL